MKPQNQAVGAAVSRRQFIQLTGLGLALTSIGTVGFARAEQTAGAQALNAYVHIGSDGVITLFAPNPDVGQGVNTALPMILAEELDADWGDVVVVNAATDAKRYGFQFAGGSLSVPRRWDELRRMGAMARALLMQAASNAWNVPLLSLRTEGSKVFHDETKRELPYADLAVAAAALTLPDPESLALKSPDQYRLLGQRITSVSADAIARGESLFGIDVQRPDMVYASYVKCPQIGGVPKSANLADIKALPGVLDAFMLEAPGGPLVFEFPAGTRIAAGVAIVATDTWSAFNARKQLVVDWDTTLASRDDTDLIYNQASAAAERGVGDKVIRTEGDPQTALSESAIRHKAFYSAALISHAQLEPQSCVAHVLANQAEIWTTSQTPSAIQDALPGLLRMAPEAVTVHSIRGGGGFGRRLSNEYVYEAALISQRVKRPVKLQWQREDDMAFDFFRAALYLDLEAGLNKAGQLDVWKHHVIAGSADGEKPNYGSDYRQRNFPEDRVANLAVSQTVISSMTPTGPWRAPVSNIYAFAEQSFLNELAVKAGVDYRDFLLQTLGEDEWITEGDSNALNTARAKAVIRAACDDAGWGRTLAPGRGLGLAFFFSHAGHVAEVAEVSVDGSKRVKVHDVWVAADVGQVINLSGVENQIEGSVIDGLSALANQQIHIKNGKVQETNFDQYSLLRISKIPRIHVRMMNSGFAPTGAGEPALPPLAPAVGNAIFAACGERVRSLPISREGFVV